ncbi:hypothetical protein [Rossellomorea sp. DUT-2]|uniref:hypothetical protein n=1 Tax=Rossellomorea sp. DUT-2 TaxID=3412021 RepID=UPI003D182A57
MMESSLEKRKQLSVDLVNHLRHTGQSQILHDLACLWARYDCEDFGSLSYIKELLDKEDFDLAKDYYSLCQRYIQASSLWKKSPELLDYKEWLEEQKAVMEQKTKKNSKTQGKSSSKGNANAQKRISKNKKK